MKTGRRIRIKAEMLRESPCCHWCEAPLTMQTATLDHRIPKAKGGSDARRNLVLSCEPCNVAKGDMMPHEFWRALASGEVATPKDEPPAPLPLSVPSCRPASLSLEHAMRWAWGARLIRESKQKEVASCR